ncbi:MAG: TipAS antibiotic-recognition domain-containing protein [Thermotogota bacterium]
MLTGEESYREFRRNEIARTRAEARSHDGEAEVEESERRVRAMPKDEWAAVGREGEAVNTDLAALMGHDPTDSAVGDTPNTPSSSNRRCG